MYYVSKYLSSTLSLHQTLQGDMDTKMYRHRDIETGTKTGKKQTKTKRNRLNDRDTNKQIDRDTDRVKQMETQLRD